MKALRAIVQRATLCARCKKDIPRDAEVIWIEGEGIFHENCSPVTPPPEEEEQD